MFYTALYETQHLYLILPVLNTIAKQLLLLQAKLSDELPLSPRQSRWVLCPCQALIVNTSMGLQFSSRCTHVWIKNKVLDNQKKLGKLVCRYSQLQLSPTKGFWKKHKSNMRLCESALHWALLNIDIEPALTWSLQSKSRTILVNKTSKPLGSGISRERWSLSALPSEFTSSSSSCKVNAVI